MFCASSSSELQNLPSVFGFFWSSLGEVRYVWSGRKVGEKFPHPPFFTNPHLQEDRPSGSCSCLPAMTALHITCRGSLPWAEVYLGSWLPPNQQNATCFPRPPWSTCTAGPYGHGPPSSLDSLSPSPGSPPGSHGTCHSHYLSQVPPPLTSPLQSQILNGSLIVTRWSRLSLLGFQCCPLGFRLIAPNCYPIGSS